MSGLYVHIPFCQSKCSYCAFYSEEIEKHDTARLTAALIAHMDTYDLSGTETVYIGGGSPSVLPPGRLLRLIEYITANCPRIDEFTVEVNPAQADLNLLHSLYEGGVNRISIGAQSFIQEELKLLSRVHNVGQIQTAFDHARTAGFENISLDLIFAIPGSTLEKFEYSLEKAVQLAPGHISAYSLSIEPCTPICRAVQSGSISAVDEETDRQMYETAIDKLAEAGLLQYEISNFAKPGFECRHNLACWQNRPFTGIGPAAASYHNGTRSANIPDIKEYVKAIENGLSVKTEVYTPTKEDIAHETAVLNLRTRRGIKLEDFKQKTGFDAMQMFDEPIAHYLKQGLLELDRTRGTLTLTRKALPIADSVICDFT